MAGSSFPAESTAESDVLLGALPATVFHWLIKSSMQFVFGNYGELLSSSQSMRSSKHFDAHVWPPSRHPGRLGGIIMARTNAGCGAWVTDLLDVGPNDNILEVGFGPGVVIQRLSKLASAGHV
jgi:hypothetical protein